MNFLKYKRDAYITTLYATNAQLVKHNPGQNYLRICTPSCTVWYVTTLFPQQLICGTKSPSPQVKVVSYQCLRIRVALEHTTTLLLRGGGKGGRCIARMLRKMVCECDIFSTAFFQDCSSIYSFELKGWPKKQTWLLVNARSKTAKWTSCKSWNMCNDKTHHVTITKRPLA